MVESSELSFRNARIAVVGVGGAGNNTVTRLNNLGVKGAYTIAINTDKQQLDVSKADLKLLIGEKLTKGLGAGGDPELGRKAAEHSRSELEKILGGYDLVFITAGMGGGTGTGASPVIANICKQSGAIVIGFVSTPFRAERARLIKAAEGLNWLRQEADSVIVLDNNKLITYYPTLTVEEAFYTMDMMIADTVKSLSETISQPSLINIDFADVKAVMSKQGVSVMLVGEAEGPPSTQRVHQVVRNTLSHPLLEVDYTGATGCLIHLSGGPDLSIKEAQDIVESLTEVIDPKANVIMGIRISEDLQNKIKVLAIMTGVRSPQVLGKAEPEPLIEFVR